MTRQLRAFLPWREYLTLRATSWLTWNYAGPFMMALSVLRDLEKQPDPTPLTLKPSELLREWFGGALKSKPPAKWRELQYRFEGAGMSERPLTLLDPLAHCQTKLFDAQKRGVSLLDGSLVARVAEEKGGARVLLANCQLIMEQFFDYVSAEVVDIIPVDYGELPSELFVSDYGGSSKKGF